MSRLLGRLVAFAVRALAWTWRVRVRGEMPTGPAVLRMWHEDLLTLAGVGRGHSLAVLVSHSGDGDWAAGAARILGYDVVRGSSSRGAIVSMRMLVRQLAQGRRVAVAVDGPRGPRRREGLGPTALARMANAELLQLGVEARPAVRLPTWDRQLIPLPFARVEVSLG